MLPPNCSNDAVFETSALNRIVDDPTVLERVEQQISMLRLRLIVPMLYLQEMASAADLTQLERRGKALRRLRDSVPFGFAPNTRGYEFLEDGRQLFATPVLSRHRERRELRGLPGWSRSRFTDADHARVRAHVEGAKARMLEFDRRVQVIGVAREQAGGRGPAATVKVLRDRDQAWLPNLDWLVKRALGGPNARVRWHAVVRRPERFKAAIAWAGMAFQTMFGALLPASAGHPEAQRLRVKRGAWYDNDMAACAAYARFLVANDADGPA